MNDIIAEPKKPSRLSNAIAIIGSIILIIIIIWGIVHLVQLSLGWFSSSEPTLTLNVPADVTAGAPVPVSWSNPSSADGSYSLLFKCTTGFNMALITASTTAVGIPCGTAVPLAANATSVQILPMLSGTTTASVPLTIIFNQANSTTTIEGSATITVHPGTLAVTHSDTSATQSTKKPTTTAQTTKKRSSGLPDLTVRIIAVGVIDPSTGAFVQRAPTSAADTGAVEFDIANTGSASTGTWYFEASLPTLGNGYFYVSPAQASLAPGDHIMNTLRFTEPQVGGGSVGIVVDPDNTTRESSYANNTATARLVSAYGY